jgi:hypothetical protein
MQIATFSRPFLAGATTLKRLPYQNEVKMKGAGDNNRHCNFKGRWNIQNLGEWIQK